MMTVAITALCKGLLAGEGVHDRREDNFVRPHYRGGGCG